MLKQTSIYDEIPIEDPRYNIVGYGIREDLNRIEVKLRDFNDTSIKKFQNTISDSKMVIFTKGEDISIEQGISLNPGATVRNARGANSTAGFRVMYNGKMCITVAGHTVYKNEYMYVGSNYLGTCLESNFGNRVDAAIVEVSTLYTPTNVIHCTGQSLSTSTRVIPIGGSVNLCGQATGHHSGTVIIASYTGTVEGQPFTDIVQVQYTQSTTGGDSGGPVYSYSYPYYYTVGTHIGSSPTYAYYTKFSNIQNLYGVTRY